MWLLGYNCFRSQMKRKILINSVEFRQWSFDLLPNKQQQQQKKYKLNSKVKFHLMRKSFKIRVLHQIDVKMSQRWRLATFFFSQWCVIYFLDFVILPYWFVISMKTKSNQQNEIMSAIQSGCWEHSLISKTASSVEFPIYRMPHKIRCAFFFLLNWLKCV